MFFLPIPGETSSVDSAAGARMPRSKRLILPVVMFGVLFGAGNGSAESHVSEARHGAPTSSTKLEKYGKVPLSFEPNRGQTSAEVQWVARGPEYALFLSGHDAVLELNSITPKKGMIDRPKIDSAAVRMNLLGAKTVKDTEGEEAQPGKANYFTGRDQSKWLSEVPTFGKVRLREVYPGIDLVYHGRQGRLEYDFVVSPGADPTKIALEFDGAKAGLAANGDLVLPVNQSQKEVRFDKPMVYQMKEGVREPVAGAFHIGSDGKVSFALGSYDKTRELVIDPTLVFDGQIGTGNQQTIPTGMAVDSLGEMVITGYTNDLTFPVTTGAYQTTCSKPTDPFVTNGMTRCGVSSAPSAFVTKLSADGGSLIYSTYLHGGGGFEEGQSVVVDAAGDAYILGQTSSNDFPITSNAYQTTCQPTATGTNNAPVSQCDNFSNGGGTEYTVNGPTLFIAKLNPLGTALLYSTFFGGTSSVYPVGLALDSAGNMVFASSVSDAFSADVAYPSTFHIQFPLTDTAYQTTGINIATPAVSKLSADGQTLLYSTFLGSQALNVGHESYNQAFALGQNGIAFIGGYTATSDFPTTAGSVKPACTLNTNNHSYCQTTMGFVAAIDTTKSGAASLVYASYLGGETTQGSNIPEQEVAGLAADANNDLFVTGYTYASNFPTTTGAFQTSCPVQSNTGSCPETGFLTKINPAGSALTWSTFVGGAVASPPYTYGEAITLDSQGKVYLYGFSQDIGGFPQVNPVQTDNGGNKVFVTEFTPDGTTLVFGTRFGSTSTTTASSAFPVANGIVVDAAGNIYITGYTNDGGTFGTTPGTYSTPATNGFNRTFFAKISPNTPPVPNNGLTTNLLLNPGAELGSLADWTIGGNGTPQVDTGTFDPGISPHTGNYDFVGGANSNTDSLSQTVSIITQGITAAQVDGGTLFANVSFWEQGKNEGDPSDSGSVTLTFLNASNATISTVTAGPEDSHSGSWFNVTGVYAIPAGTRSITYTMNFIRNQQQDNDAFIDDNVLSIHTDTGLTISPSTLHFGNVPVGQLSQSQTATVTNNQTTAITIDQIISELGADPSEFGVSTYCPQGSSLAAGASCPVTITFAPTAVGPQSAGIAINTESVPPLQQIAVDGNGTGGILQVNPGNLKTIAGNGTAGDSGDGGQATLAQLNQPNGVAFDPSGNLYIADDQANVIRKVDTTGKITTFAGTGGPAGFSGDGGPATAAQLSIPFSVASDKSGNIYIQDTGNYVIRKVDASTGIITTVAGTPGMPGRAGDGGPATQAKLNENQGARFDSAGNLFVALCPTGTIRKIDTTGVITTVAGTPGTSGFSGDGGQATQAQLQCPSGVTIDAAGNFYIADEFNQVIRKVNTAGVISTIAGTPGVAGYSGDGGAATSARFNDPNDVVIDSLGNLYVADSGNNRVRKIDTNGTITTASGGLNSAGSAAVNTPLAVTVDTANNVYFSDSGNSKIEEIFPQGTQPFPATAVGSTAPAQSLTLSNIGNVDVTLAADGAFTTSGNAGDFALSAGSCGGGTVLTANGGVCELSITFTPTAVGQRTLTVTIADDALNTPQSFSIGGTGIAAGSPVTPTITWATPAPITTATPLSATQLDATAADASGNAIPGTFVYTPAAGTLLPAGTQTLSVTFTPTDTTDFTTATKTVQIVVTQAGGGTGTGTATATRLSVTSGGQAATTVASASVVTLTATVTAGTAAVNPGQVAFCDATAVSCTGIHLLGTAQLTSSGKATYKFVPGIGAHSYRAVFLGTMANAGSASVASALAVTGTIATTTTIAQSGPSGSPAAYTLKATTVGAGPYPVPNATQSVTINLGQSAQNYVLTGTGPSMMNDATYGNYYNTQGNCATVGNTTTCDLTGNFTSSTAGYAAGTYDFQTVFTGPISSSVTSQTEYPVGTNEPNDFQYSAFAPGTTMVLKLNVTGGGVYTIPLVENGNFDPNLDNIGFADTSAVCGGTSLGSDPCQQDYVGTVPGATYSSPVTGLVQFEMASPPTLVGPTGTVSFVDTSNANAVLGTAALGASTPGLSFASQSSTANVENPQTRSAVADFNGDGILDVATASTAPDPTPTIYANSVTISLGNGDGTFNTLESRPATGNRPQSIVAGDFNGDGKADLAVTNISDGTVTILLGNGDGTFTAAATAQASANAYGLVTGDFNGDGNLDLAVSTLNGIAMLLGNGDGTFVTHQITLPSASNEAYGPITTADFNGDGKADLIVEGYSPTGGLVVLLGNGDGSFATGTPISLSGQGSNLNALVAGDFNGDGKPDFAATNSSQNTVLIMLGNGDGTFTTTAAAAATFYDPQDLQTGDFDGDGKLDLVVMHLGGSHEDVLLGNGDGTFTTAGIPTGVYAYNAITVGDFNGDGVPDIAATDGSTNLEIALTQRTQTAMATATGIAPAGAGNHAVVASYPGDGNFTKSVSSATTLVGTGPVTPVTPTITWATPAAITTTTPLSATQLDATATDASGAAVPGTFVYTPAAGTLLAAGTQTLSVTFTPTDTTDFTTATKTVQIVVTQPVATTTTTTLAVTSGGETATTVASGSVVTLTAQVTAGGNSVSPGQVAFCDATAASCMDNHLLGTVELVGGDSTSTATYKFVPGIGIHSYKAVFLGTAKYVGSASAASALAVTGTYATTTALTSTGTQGSYALTATVDGFGLGSPTGSVVFKDTSTNGTLGTVPVSSVVRSLVAGGAIAGVSNPQQVVTADVNGDGKPDLVVANGSGTMVTVLLGNGDGTYTALPSFGSNYDGITGVAVADFNGDGKLDIATANQSTVGIFLGNGDGTFGAEQDFANTNTSAGVFAGDFNGDGKVDLAVPDRYSGMTILIGNGDGTFTQPNPAFAVGASPNYHSAIADFNGDGKLDIAAGNYFDNTVSILLGNGDGTFQAPATYATGAAPTATFAGDFNGDGIPDIFLTNFNGGTISVLLGKGDGTFQAQQAYTVGSSPNGAAVGDLNGDGKLDITVANQNDGTVSILYGNGDGTFQAQQVIASGNGADAVAIVDVNGDGSPDLAAVNANDNTVTVFVSQAVAAVPLTGVTLPGTGSDNVVATYGGDTAFAGSTSNTLTLPSNPAGAMTPTTTSLTIAPTAAIVGQQVTFSVTVAGTGQTIPTGTVTLTNTGVTPAAVLGTITLGTTGAGSYSTATLPSQIYTVTATYNGDASNAMSTSSATTLEVVPYSATVTTLSLSASTAAYGQPITMTANVSFPGGAVSGIGQVAFCDAAASACDALMNLGVAHLVSDGSAVFHLAGGSIGQHQYVAKYLGTPVYLRSSSSAQGIAITGTYPTATTIAQSGTAGNYSLTATTVGTSPLLTGPTGTVSFLDTTNVNAVLGTNALGASTKGFALAQATGSPVAVGAGPYGMATGDFNGDGFTDLVVQNYNSGTVSVLLGKGDGTFQPQVTYPVGNRPERVLVADLNGDGKLDLVVANTGSNTISVLLGKGDGTFQAQVTYPCASPVGLGVMDINYDGVPDVVAGDYYSNTISVLLGNGDGTLKAAVTYATGNTPQTVAEGDFNGDGIVDVVVGNFGGATVGVFLGNGDGTFKTMVTYAVGKQPQGVQVGDFNGDGKQDLAVSNSGDGTIGVLLGNGDGTFQTQVTYPVGVQPVGLAIGDFNGDGIEDITVGNTGQASLTQSVLLGKGDGTFAAQVAFPAGNFPYGTTTGDFNGDGLPDIVAANYNDGTATIFLSTPTETATATATGISPTGTGTHAVVASYPGDVLYGKSVSQATNLIVGSTATVITWTPAVATIPYGTALGASQLNAAAATAAGVAIPGTFVYTPAAGTILTAGTQTLRVAFTPTDAVNFAAATGSATITVTQVAPVITWAAPAGIAYGTPLSVTQLDATVAGVGTGALAGTLVYTPPAGTVLLPGTQTLNVAFTPTDAVDYTTATASVPIVVGGLALSSFTPVGALSGSADTKITLTGTGFVTTSVVMANGAAVATTYVNPVTLTAVIPAALLKTTGTIAITVLDPSLDAATAAQTFTVVPPAGAATLTGPATTPPASQPTVTLSITIPYPLALTAQFSLAFASVGTTPVDDPSIQFSSGGRTYSYMVAANSTSVPPVQLQAGTDAGTITITAKLMADGVDVTPAGLAPLVIVVPPVVPSISGTTITASGNTLTVVIHGFSNTREVSAAVFDFTAATGDTLATTTLTIPATTIFGTWYGDAASIPYGSTFTYTQTFDTSADASTIGSVKVTLTNSVGTSVVSTSP